MTVVRPANEDDLGGIAAVALACGQPPSESAADAEYVRHLLAHGTVAVATACGSRVIGFGATRQAGGASVLTDLFVSPRHQRGGVGREILRALWNGDDGTRITFSSQHPSAVPLYIRFGLTPLWPLLYLRGSPAFLEGTDLEVRRVSGNEAAAVERNLTGTDRRVDYAYWLRKDPAGGLVVLDRDETIAAGAVTASGVVHFVCVSPTRSADALIAALIACGDDELTACVPGPHPALPVLLRSRFTVEDYDIHMSSNVGFARVTSVYAPGLA